MTEVGKAFPLDAGRELPGDSAQAGADTAGVAIAPGELRNVFLRSLGWTGAARLAAALGGALRYIVFARLLSPYDFGVFGAASVVEVLLRELTDPNLARALVPRKEEINRYLDTVWSAAVAQGVLIATVLIVAARPLARFFQIGHLGSAFVAIAPFPIVWAMASPAVAARIYRDLDFRVSLILNVAELVAGITFGLAAIWLWRDWRGLVIATYAAQLTRTALSYYFYPYRPRLAFDPALARLLFKFGGWITARRMAEGVARKIDSLAVGHLLGPHVLGEYQFAFRAGELSTFEAAYATGLVMFPMMRRLDRRGIGRLLVAANTLVLVSGILYAGAIWGWGGQIISLAVGSKWLGALPPLRLLCLFGIFAGLLAVGTQCLDGLNAPESSFKVSLVGMAALMILVVPLTLIFGVNGTAAAVVASAVIPLPWMFRLQREARRRAQ